MDQIGLSRRIIDYGLRDDLTLGQQPQLESADRGGAAEGRTRDDEAREDGQRVGPHFPAD